ncbi:hypothetical protein LJY25_07885 [Hymenobacter sp. BT175]|uniref:hypothetical protein n=1 Tax=Hymenobacter translucens TaxID=2886507 RepID=UPI001D0E619E|nr:hypothetical protein [Hymenobacter translucens]MCC2546361.1 hypothetical protein [Hymenobacter translucens]
MNIFRLSPWLPAGLLLAALPACLSLQSEEQRAEAAEKAVLARHDELMLQMDQLYLLRQQLQKATAADTQLVSRRRRELLAAEAGMMDWMHQYRRPADTVAPARAITYYAAQQLRIDSVGQLMRASQDSARALLRRTGTTPTSPRT